MITGTHIGLTIWLLPNGPARRSGLVGMHKANVWDKFLLLAQPGSWNSLLFGNILITFFLFCVSSTPSRTHKRGRLGDADRL